jgi:hypothetical protein
MGWAGHVACMGEERRVYRVLVGKPEWKRPLGRPRHRWVNNIRMDLQEVGCGHMDWIGLTQDRDRWRMLVSVVMNLRVPWNAGNLLTSCKPVSFSRRTLHHGVSKYIMIMSPTPYVLSVLSNCMLNHYWMKNCKHLGIIQKKEFDTVIHKSSWRLEIILYLNWDLQTTTRKATDLWLKPVG